MEIPRKLGSIDKIFHSAVFHKASDIHIKANSVPRIRVDGDLKVLNIEPVEAEHIKMFLNEFMDEVNSKKFAENNEVDFAMDTQSLGRFRVNAYRTRGSYGLVARIVSNASPHLSELGVPDIIGDVSLSNNGLCIISGPTGSGKSTTLAGMVNHINENKNSHIVTLEDPIEIIHEDKNSVISQREIFSDTKDFPSALKSALRQDPDVIVIGEMRDPETVRAAIHAAETGHLVLTTLHTTQASDTISRIIEFFPDHERHQIRISLASSLRAIFGQRLLAGFDGQRIPAVEVLLNQGRISEAILDPSKTTDIHKIISESESYGMQTFDASMLNLLREEKISVQTAQQNTTSLRNFNLILRQQHLLP